MDRTTLRALLLGSLVAVLLMIAGPKPALAEDLEGAGMTWVEGWEAGRAQAKKDGKLIFLYFGRHSPPCPPCKFMEDTVFSKAESVEISTQYTAARLYGGDDVSPEGEAFMQRYGVLGFPTMLAMTADGAVVNATFSVRTLAGVLASMSAGQTAETEFRQKEATLGKSKEEAPLREMAGLYKARMQYDEARSRYETLTASAPKVEDQLALLEVLDRLGDNAARKALLANLVKTRADHAWHVQWRIQFATADLAQQPKTRDEAREIVGKKRVILEGLLAELTKPADQAAVRSELAGILMHTNETDAAVAHWDWILEHARDTEAGADALWGKGSYLIRRGQFEANPEYVKQARALWQEIGQKHPGHPQAAMLPGYLPQIEALIQMLDAKQAEAAGDEDEGEDEGGDDDK